MACAPSPEMSCQVRPTAGLRVVATPRTRGRARVATDSPCATSRPARPRRRGPPRAHARRQPRGRGPEDMAGARERGGQHAGRGGGRRWVRRRRVELARQAEVGNEHAAVAPDQHVPGLEVAVHEAGAVRSLEPPPGGRHRAPRATRGRPRASSTAVRRPPAPSRRTPRRRTCRRRAPRPRWGGAAAPSPGPPGAAARARRCRPAGPRCRAAP